MKHNGIMLKIAGEKVSVEEANHATGEQHIEFAQGTPLREDAFDLTDEQKISIISVHMREIMNTLGLNMEDDSLKGTPARVAKMFVKDIFSGLNPKKKPVITLFENKFKFNQMLVEKNITLYSNCEHHLVPIIRKVHIGYISSGKVIGLSKINRLVQYYARRPQVQERMTIQIANELKSVLQTQDVAVVIDASHLCVSSRGVRDTASTTITSEYGGVFLRPERRSEFLKYIY